MQTDFLIVGQGISGSLLYHALTKAGADCIVIDEDKPNSASKVAAGLINPVTGRRLVKSWMIDELLPSIKEMYAQIEMEYKIRCFSEKELTWFLPAPDIVQAFEKRMIEKTDYLAENSSHTLSALFNFPYKAGNIKPCYVVDLQQLLPALRNKMERTGKLVNEKFKFEKLVINSDSIHYGEITSKKIIFCEGSAAVNNPWFSQLPYSLNKGEALIVEIDDLAKENIYKFKQTLVPLGAEHLWWYGSNYTWDFENDQPTPEYRRAAAAELKGWLKIPFKIVDHKAAIRYATVERRPFLGLHPKNSSVGIFNGWGTKGCSLVPFFAEHFTNFLLHNKPLLPESDICRFSKILGTSGKTF